MNFARSCMAALGMLAAVLSAPVSAQSVWHAVLEDNGSLIFGYLRGPSEGLSFGCTAPSPRGVPLMDTGSHESHRTDPYQMVMGVRDSWFNWEIPYWQRGATLTIDGVVHTLPDFQLNELQGTAIYMPLSAPLVQGLYDARSVMLTTPQGTTHHISTGGLGVALDTMFRGCIDRWVEMGHGIPAALSRFVGPPLVSQPAAPSGIPMFNLSGGNTSVAPQPVAPMAGIPRFNLPEGAVPAPPLVLPSVPASKAPRAATTIALLPSVILQHLREACGGQARIEDRALVSSDDLDGDGAPDYILHYTDVYCQPGDHRAFCGAANCSIEIFVSSRGYRRPFEFLALDVRPVRAVDGRIGLTVSGTPFICADGACDRAWHWNGQTFSQN